MTSLFLDLGRNLLGWLLLVYTVVAVTHYVIQLVFAHRTYRRQRAPEFAGAHPGIDVPIDIVVPVYNEEPALLEACLASAVAQDYRGRIQVIVVDDGSPNRASLDPIYDRFEDLGVRVVRAPQNAGKRQAQALALPLCEGEILVTLDSDSVLAPDAVRMLTRQFDDPKVGAATGFVDVANRTANLLTRIQRIRYWMAFNQERAAQTWFRTVMCCSGPLAAYRRALVESVRDSYLSQSYGGVACTYGDDRHLTNLVLGGGHDVVFDSGAVAFTNVPTRLRGFLRQQLRWNKSFYRELIWTLPFIGSRPLFSRFDVACQVAMPIMLTVTAGSALVIGVFSDSSYILRYLLLIAAAALVRSTYAAIRERDPGFYLFVLYGYVSSFLLVSVRFRALSTLTDARWGTRGPATQGRVGGALGSLISGVRPLVTAAQAIGWQDAPLPRRWTGGSARLEGALRAGPRTRMMAHPDPAVGLAPAPVITGTSGVLDEAPVTKEPVPDWSSLFEPWHPAAGSPESGPPCGHAVAAWADAPFCKACGAVLTPRLATADAGRQSEPPPASSADPQTSRSESPRAQVQRTARARPRAGAVSAAAGVAEGARTSRTPRSRPASPRATGNVEPRDAAPRAAEPPAVPARRRAPRRAVPARSAGPAASTTPKVEPLTDERAVKVAGRGGRGTRDRLPGMSTAAVSQPSRQRTGES